MWIVRILFLIYFCSLFGPINLLLICGRHFFTSISMPYNMNLWLLNSTVSNVWPLLVLQNLFLCCLIMYLEFYQIIQFLYAPPNFPHYLAVQCVCRYLLYTIINSLILTFFLMMLLENPTIVLDAFILVLYCFSMKNLDDFSTPNYSCYSRSILSSL